MGRIQKSQNRTTQQVVKALKQSGWQCSLIVIQIGVRGGIPNTTISGMKTLGIATKDIQLLCTKLTEKSSVASVKAWWTRHAQCKSSTHNSPQAWKGRPISRQEQPPPHHLMALRYYIKRELAQQHSPEKPSGGKEQTSRSTTSQPANIGCTGQTTAI